MEFNWKEAQKRLRAKLEERKKKIQKMKPRTNAKIRRNRTRIGMTEC